MASLTPQPGPSSIFAEAVSGHRSRIYDELEALWQNHTRELNALLESSRKRIDQAIEDQLEALESEIQQRIGGAIQERVAHETETVVAGARTAARRQLGDALNLAARRMRQAGSEEEIYSALLDAAVCLASRAAVFQVSGQWLRNGRVAGVGAEDIHETLHSVVVPLEQAAAFANAAESLDTVVAARASGELSEPVAAVLGESAEQRAYFIPVASRHRALAVLYVESGEAAPDAGALEVLASFAAFAIESRTQGGPAKPGTLLAIHPASEMQVITPAAAPDWTTLEPAGQELHLRARRFARVQVAEIRLYHSSGVKQGRLKRNLYSELKTQIEAGREAFRKEFLESSGNPHKMVDYFHLELVRTLANDDVSLLGREYPGPLV